MTPPALHLNMQTFDPQSNALPTEHLQGCYYYFFVCCHLEDEEVWILIGCLHSKHSTDFFSKNYAHSLHIMSKVVLASHIYASSVGPEGPTLLSANKWRIQRGFRGRARTPL